MNYLIAGGTGFIGTNLVLDLSKNPDNKITILDNNYSSSIQTSIELGNIPNVTVVIKDITYGLSDMNLNYMLHKDNLLVDLDYIINLACPASPPKYQLDPIFTLNTNIIGTSNLLKLLEFNPKCVFLQASTSEIYGDPIRSPQVESDRGNVNCYGPRACYDEGKRAAETLCYEYRKKGFDVRIMRIFNTYGPYMDPDDGRVVTNFIKQALRGEDITVYGRGDQTRSFQYVDDLINGIKLLITTDNYEGPTNLGNPGEFTILELAKKVIKLTGTSSKIVHKELPIDDPLQRKPEISRARKLGFEPKIQLEEGLKRTIEYLKTKI